MSGCGDFWTRRKAMVLEEARAEVGARKAREQAAQAAVPEDRPDEEVLEDLGLPDPESLAPGDDIRAFMEKAVPEHIRRRALRGLWRRNPVLANLDGLVDYGDDFTDSALVSDALQTAYQVGRGMVARVEPTTAAQDVPDAPAGQGAADAGRAALTRDAARNMAREEEPDRETAGVATRPDPAPEASGADDTPAMPRRRMRFSFADRAGAVG